MITACSSCKFYSEKANGDGGVCRRFPPQIAALPAGDVIAFFPEVSPTGWCGEWNLGPKRKEPAT